ncbi:MAG: tetratricopeptide repeat protein [Acidimicrobiales bacterium]|nr:tetratricopeptide repeat protein [Acidimicrobiales bacterium]
MTQAQLARTFARRGDEFAAAGDIDRAEAAYFRSLTHRPEDSRLLRKIASLYLESGRLDEARLCWRGVIPDAANERFFDPARLAARTVSIAEDSASRSVRVIDAESRPLPRPVAHGKERRVNQFNRRHTVCVGSFVSHIPDGEVWFDGVNTLVGN